MSNVIAFPKRPNAHRVRVQAVPASDALARMEIRMRDSYWMRDNWRTSQKGNLYVLVDGRCVTWFRHRGGWSWSITKDDGDETLWSPRTHASESDSRRDAWDALVTFYDGPDEPA